MLIFGKNMDNLNLPGILDNRILVFARPDKGIGHAFVTAAALVCCPVYCCPAPKAWIKRSGS